MAPVRCYNICILNTRTHMHVRTHTHTHTQAKKHTQKSIAKPTAAVVMQPPVHCPGAKGRTGRSSWGQGWYPTSRRRPYHVPRVKVWAPKVPPGLTHYARHGQLAFALPVNTRSPLIQLGRLEQCE